MKKIVTFLKIGFITFSLAIMFGVAPTQQRVSAFVDGAGCATTSCPTTYGGLGCGSCPNNECNGCYRQNGESGCGVCSKGANEESMGTMNPWLSFELW